MAVQSLTENPENTHQAILFCLKRRQEMSVADLCAELNITAMAVRRHLTGLQKDGLIDCRLTRKGRGRPAYQFHLTEKASSLFPSGIGNLAFELLDAVYHARGTQGITELLALRDEATVARLTPQLEQLSLKERIGEVAQIFAKNGYMTKWQELEDGNFFIYQQHCAVHSLAVHFRQICAMESRLLEKLLGHRISRQQYIMKNDPVCGYLVHANESLTADYTTQP